MSGCHSGRIFFEQPKKSKPNFEKRISLISYMKKSVLLLILFMKLMPVAGQNKVWEKKGNTPSRIIKIEVDSKENTYTVGDFQDSFNMGTAHLKTTAKYGAGFIISYDKTGKFRWAIKLDSMFPEMIKVTINDELLIYGDSTGKGLYSYFRFLMKLDSKGNIKWIKNTTDLYSLKTCPNGNILLIGSAFFNKDTFRLNDILITNKDSCDINCVLVCLDSASHFLWGKVLLSIEKYDSDWGIYPYFSEMELDKKGDIYVIAGGTAMWHMTTNSFIINKVRYNASNDNVPFYRFLKMDNLGEVLYTKTFDTLSIINFTYNKKDNHFYLPTSYSDGHWQKFNSVLYKMDTAGNIAALSTYADTTGGVHSSAYEIITDNLNNIYMTFQGKSFFPSKYSFFMTAITTSGKQRWVKDLEQDSFGSYCDIALGTPKKLFISGIYNDTSWKFVKNYLALLSNDTAFVGIPPSKHEVINNIQISPNPFSNSLQIKIENTEAKPYTTKVRLVNMLGVEVESIVLPVSGSGNKTYEIEIKNSLPAGLYELLIDNGKELLFSGGFVRE